MEQVSLLLSVIFILCLLRLERKRRKDMSLALWGVVIWVVVIGSRPVTTWFNFGGDAAAYDEGDPFERVIYLALIAQGIITLNRRKVKLGSVVRNNRWLAIFFLFWGISVLWSDAPVVALKRWIKDIGNVVMVLVILTERNPAEACKAVFVRCGYILIPLSVLLIRFIPNLGRVYHVWSGEMMFTGVATHKNTLGVLVLVCGLFLVRDFVERWRSESKRRNWLGVALDVSVLAMTIWLLLKARSATAMGCAAAGVIIYYVTGLKFVRTRAAFLGRFAVLGGVMIWILNSVVDIKRLIIVDIFGRDMTLTTRTDVWPMLLAQSDSALVGSGFNSFWSGDRLEAIYSQLGIIQAHSGYLETYLNGGMLGIGLLALLLLASAKRIQKGLVQGDVLARGQLTFLVIAIIYNLTEAAYNKMGLVWFVLLLAITRYHVPAKATAGVIERKNARPLAPEKVRVKIVVET